MSYHVKVSGIPTHVKLPSLIPLLSDILSMNSSNFYLRALSSKGPYNEILLSLSTYIDAQLVEKKLNNFVYKNNNVSFTFTAKISDSNKQDSKNSKSKSSNQNKNFKGSYEHEQSNQMKEGYYEDRSCSPHVSNTSPHLDMQIKILKKQRMILEEEKKLREEQKRLEELKMKSLINGTPPLGKKVFEGIKKAGPSPNPLRKKSQAKQLDFYQASKVILRSMDKFIRKYSTLENHKPLLKRLRAIIKGRMAIAVAAAGEGVYHTPIVIHLYRSQYPPSVDEKLVKEALKGLSAEGLSVHKTEEVQAAAKGANAEDKPFEVKSFAGNHQVQDELATAKDTNFSGVSNVCESNKETKTSTKPNKSNKNKKSQKEITEKRLYFHNASGVLLHKMRVHINKYAPKKKRKLLADYLRFTLKQRLAAVVAGQPIYQTYVIINMYREIYPETEDEGLVKRLLEDIVKGNIPDDIMDKLKNVAGSVPYEKTAVSDNKTPVDETIIDEDAMDETGQSDMESTDVSVNIKNKVNVDNKFESMVESLDKPNIEKDNTSEKSETDPNVNNTEKPNNIHNNSKIDLVICNTENDPAKCNVDNNCSSNNNPKTDTAIEDQVMEAVEKSDLEEDNINKNAVIDPNVKDMEKTYNEKENSSKSNLITCNLENDIVKYNVANERDSNNDTNMLISGSKKITDNTETSVKDNHGVKRKNDEHDNNSNKVSKTGDDITSHEDLN